MGFNKLPLRCDNVSCEKVLDDVLVCGAGDTLFCSGQCRHEYRRKNDRIYRLVFPQVNYDA